MTESKLKIGVIFGGVSTEHEVSVITGIQAIAGLDKAKYDVVPIYIDKGGSWHSSSKLSTLESFSGGHELASDDIVTLVKTDKGVEIMPLRPSVFGLQKRYVDILFPCLHGGLGEGGGVQGLAEMLGIPIVGTGTTGAVLGMDKVAMKHLFTSTGLKQAPYRWFYRQEWQKNQAVLMKDLTSVFRFPMFVKPSRGGSSIGTTKVGTKEDLKHAVDVAAALDTRIVVEQGIEGAREVNVSVLGNAGGELTVSLPEEVLHDKGSGFLDFNNKYLTGGGKGMVATDREIPARLSVAVTKKIRDVAKTVFRLFDFSGLVRIDFLVKGNEVYVIEPNTIPGSLSFYIWDPSGIPFPELLDRLVTLAIEKHKEAKSTVTTYTSNILNFVQTTYGSKLGGKLGGKKTT